MKQYYCICLFVGFLAERNAIASEIMILLIEKKGKDGSNSLPQCYKVSKDPSVDIKIKLFTSFPPLIISFPIYKKVFPIKNPFHKCIELLNC